MACLQLHLSGDSAAAWARRSTTSSRGTVQMARDECSGAMLGKGGAWASSSLLPLSSACSASTSILSSSNSAVILLRML